MISVCLKEIDGSWFGLAYTGQEIIATSLSSAKEKALRSLVKNMQFNVEYQIVDEGSEFAERTMLMLKELESGNEESKRFSLATEYVPEPIAKVLRAAAAIPIGYVASYGDIAKASDTEPRTVGRIMASNPLYPIVPCHRVVGSDFSLVGYGGRKNAPALEAKLARLNKETKGFTAKKEVAVNEKKLVVYPAEYVIRKAKKSGLEGPSQQKLFDNRKPNNTV